MSPFEVLQIAATDDQRAIKWAYASKLKTTRPEDAPVGFRRIYEPSQQAMLRSKPEPETHIDTSDLRSAAQVERTAPPSK